MNIPERLLLGPGPSPVTARVMRAMTLPVLSHLDPRMMDLLQEISASLERVFMAGSESFSFAVSGTGSAGMEAAVANLTSSETRALVVVNGYFGDRLARMFESYGAAVTRVQGEWGRACDPAIVERELKTARYDITAVVHAETSTGVLNPVADLARVAHTAGTLTVVDTVTSLGAIPVRAGEWGSDVCYSCTQKGLGAPSGLAPITFSARARAARVPCRSFYLDLSLLEDYWRGRKYHHTISAPLIYALGEALAAAEEEGLEARWARHEDNHRHLVEGLESLGLQLLPPPGERLTTLNAVRVPAGIDDAAVRRGLLEQFNIEVGAGLGPLAGRIWRVGLMGAGSSRQNVLLFLAALDQVLQAAGYSGTRSSTLSGVRSH